MDFSPYLAVSFLYPAYLWLLLLALPLLALGWPGRNQAERRRRGWSTLIRLIVLVLLVLGLAGAQLDRPVDTLTTIFVLDVSDSIQAKDSARAKAFLQNALAEKPANDRAAVVMFGGDALVEQLPRVESGQPALTSVPIKNATDIESALRLAMALLPNEGGRIVLLSDGQETEGDSRRLLDLATARQVEISVYPLGPVDIAETGAEIPEVLVEQVSAPSQARQGQAIPIEVVVIANRPANASLRLLADGRPAESRAIRLTQGRNRFSFSLPAGEPGFHRFRVEVEPEIDGRAQNNWGAAFTTVYGPPRLLIVAGQPEDTTGLTSALDAVGLNSIVLPPAALTDSLPDLAQYDAIILANVPAAELPNSTQESIASFVRDLGRGLVMIGGPQGYGAGGYLRSPLEAALPVDMEVRSRSREPNLALVLAIDKSGSMGACHCDNPDLRQTYTRVPSGLPKIDIAKEAIFQASQLLGQADYMGVVSFDSSAHWQLETGPWVGAADLEQAIAGIAANGQTNIYAGLAAAEEALSAAPARIKHIILLTDGWSLAGAYDELTARLAEEGITLSVVAAGNGSAEYLAELARKGGGQYYPAASMSDVPQIFFKETIRAVGNYIIEEPFVPAQAVSGADGSAISAILRGIDIDQAGLLLGYNGTTPKDAARVILLTPRGDPLLATWQYGLGRAVAWTSDLGGRWAQEWLAWEGFPRLVGQMVNWSLPAPADDRLELAVSASSHEATLAASVQDEAGRPQSFLDVSARLIEADGQVVEVELRPTGSGRYETVVPLLNEGVYLAQVIASLPEDRPNTGEESSPRPVASRTTGLVIPYSAEYASLTADPALLADLAAATGGGVLDEPSQAFSHTLPVGRETRSLWPALLLLVALLFPADVAIRRLRLSQREWRQMRAWLGQHTPALLRRTSASQPDRPTSATVQALRQARQRVQQRRTVSSPARPGQSQPLPPARPAPARPPESGPTPAAPEPPAEKGAEDTLSRLREAKKRARQK